MKRVVILGSTGSIGTQALEVIRNFKDKFKVVGIAANKNISLIKKQISEFAPEIVSIGSENYAHELDLWCRKHNYKTQIIYGERSLSEIAKYLTCDIVLSALVGAVGLKPLLSAISKSKDIAIANKEALVIAGELIIKEAKNKNVTLIPVDSEHSAIFQCLKNEPLLSVENLILTASGGPFYNKKSKHYNISINQALKHPTWKMGKKITIDSATLMNKGLEIIEAHFLFNIPINRIKVVIHPQSIIHSMVSFKDGSILAHMSIPDMRLPIQYALSYPERFPSLIKRLDLTRVHSLIFEKPDFKRFRCPMLAIDAAKAGGTMPSVMNAANEIAVNAFLEGKIRFDKIPILIEKVMRKHKIINNPNLDEILDADKEARLYAKHLIEV